jgi:hypothetical protein
VRRILSQLFFALVLVSAGIVLPASAVADNGASGIGASGNSGHGLSGGGGGGTLHWYEHIGGNIAWPSKSRLDQTRGGSTQSFIDLGNEMTVDRCAPHSFRSSTCPLWTAERVEGSNFYSRELHDFAGPRQWAGGVISERIVALFNVRVWREGSNQPVLERRAGVQYPAQADADQNNCGDDLQNLACYWLGGREGHYWFANPSDPFGGPLTTPKPGNPICDTSISGADNPTNTAKGTTIRPPRTQGNDCFYEHFNNEKSWTDANGKPLHESLYIKWKLPRSTNGHPVVKYHLIGEPNKFYAIQIVAQDNRERIMGLHDPSCAASNPIVFTNSTTDTGQRLGSDDSYHPIVPKDPCAESINDGTVWYGGNIFRVWSDSGAPQVRGPDISGAPEPDVSVDLSVPPAAGTQSKIPARITTDTLSSQSAASGALSAQQANFVRIVRLLHFTPQITYNGSAANTTDTSAAYPSHYAIYDSDTRGGNRLAPAAFAGPYATVAKNNQNAGHRTADSRNQNPPPSISQFQNLLKLPQAPQLTDATGNHSENNYNIQYLRPTKHNPCTQNLSDASLKGNWPDNPWACSHTGGGDLRNAWDDTYAASATWESRWVDPSSSATPDLGLIVNQTLRCDHKSHRNGGWLINASCPMWHNLEALGGSAATRAQQYAAGYLNLAHPDNQSGARAKVVLDDYDTTGCNAWQLEDIGQRCNQRASMSSWRIVNRGSGQPPAEAKNAYSQPNTITGRPEMWFCNQGPPPGLHRTSNDSSTDNVGAKDTEGNPNGDPLAHDQAAHPGDNLTAGNDDTDYQRNNCRGFAVRWIWNDAGNTWDQNVCALRAPSGNEDRFRLIGWPHDQWGQGIDAHGGPGAYRNPGDVPYAGAKPGSNHGNTQICTLNVTGHYAWGQWNTEYTWRTAPDSPTYCQYLTQAQAENAYNHAGNFRPAVHQGDPTAEACGSRHWWFGNAHHVGDHHYGAWFPYWRLGWWYRSNAWVNWDAGSCTYGLEDPNNTHVWKADGRSLDDVSDQLGSTPNNPNGLGADGNHFLATGIFGNVHAKQNYFTPCNTTVQGWVPDGHWEIDSGHPEGRGWGANNSGHRLPDGQYNSVFTFNTNAGTSDNVWWRMFASYDGHKEWNWRTNHNVNTPEDTNLPLRVFSPRGTT